MSALSTADFELRLRRYLRIDLQRLSRWAAAFMLVIYGAFSGPTPDTLGLPELIVALILVALVVARGLPILVFGPMAQRNTSGQVWLLLYFVALWLGLLLGVGVGALQYHWPIADISRDALPHLYYCLPILLWPYLRDTQFLRALSYGLIFAGGMFGVRHLLLDPSWILSIGSSTLFGDNNYFPVSPSVLYAACAGPVEAARAWGDRARLSGGTLALAALTAFLSIVSINTRAQIAAVVLLCVYAAGLMVLFSPLGKKIVVLTVGVSIASATLYMASPVIEAAIVKTRAVGINNRDAEFSAVLDRIAETNSDTVFGLGYGGRFEAPTVLGAELRYTHNLVSYSLLKYGILGALVILPSQLLIVVASWYGGLSFRRSMLDWYPYTILGALALVLFLHSQVSAGYKMLGFGVISCIALGRILERRLVL